MTSGPVEVRCVQPSALQRPVTVLPPLAAAGAMLFAAIALRSQPFGSVLLVVGTGVIVGTGIYAYSRWVWMGSFLRWDGTELVLHEGFGRWRVKAQKDLSTMTARVKLGGQHASLYLWVLDGASHPLLRTKVKLWPEGELRGLLDQVGCSSVDIAEPKQLVTARGLRRANKELLPFWMGHQSELTIAAAILLVAFLVAVF